MSNQPHILFILTDQQRADCLSVAGHPTLATPNMDRLAAEGTRFTQCYTTSPLCVPARMSMMNGLYPHNSNQWQNATEMPLDANTFTRQLQQRGYKTCGIGKHHLYPMYSEESFDLREHDDKYRAIGFDQIEETGGVWPIKGCTSSYTDYLAELSLYEPLVNYLNNLAAKPEEVRRYTAEALPIPAEAYMDAYIARRVETYVDNYDEGKPSFVYAGFQGPHEPWDAPDEYADRIDPSLVSDPIPELEPGDWLPERSRKYQRWAQYYPPKNRAALNGIIKRYCGKIAQIDDGIGRILAAYERKGWLENTVIIFGSDHGEMLGDLNRISKSVCYDSAVHVPLIVRLPHASHPGAECPALVETIDIHGTILELAGCPIDKDKDCLSLLPLITQSRASIRNDVLAEVHTHYMLRTDAWKIVIGRDGETDLLFDLKSDPLEQRNLCGHPDYRPLELEARSRLLTRIAGSTYRPGTVDPGVSGSSRI